MNEHRHGLPYYKKMLSLLGGLSNLFSESSTPFLDPRIAENLFCRAFNAENLSRSDVSIDAKLGELGIGIKTFIDHTGKKSEKIAEFNKDNKSFKDLKPAEKIKKIAELRNERLEATKRICGVKTLIYHCISRRKNQIIVYECSMDSINIQKIKEINASDSAISFKDDKNEYSFNLSKSTLFKKFNAQNIKFKIHVKIFKDPFEILENKLADIAELYTTEEENLSSVMLPLYSVVKNIKTVPERSGLNQWNAGGRPRDFDEIYIQIPIWIHKRFPGFFPSRDQSFDLILPDNSILSAKVCQDNSKALMTNPNSALGKWLLRAVLKLREGELLTYERLEKIGLDSVLIEKIDSNKFKINFKETGAYEQFIDEFY